MIIVEGIVYVRHAVPDIDAAMGFMTDFGLHVSARTDSALYMRGAATTHHIYIAEAGATSQGVGVGLRAASLDDLAKVAAETGAPVVRRDEPGGGSQVTLADPAGNRVDVIHGMEALDPLPTRAPIDINASGRHIRCNHSVRLARGPAHVSRLGHVALYVPDLVTSLAFYCDWLGMKVADAYYAGTEDDRIAAFLRCGLGRRFTDHHTLALAQLPKPGFDHISFEVLDWDDLMIGHDHMQRIGKYKHCWGVGRHYDGSNVFDYWRDPFGNKMERYTDGDVINDDYPATNSRFDPADPGKLLAMWGPPLPVDFLV
jgi:catechol 2,3-dioxygenase-like lactoylglutathione lyase family enzyme